MSHTPLIIKSEFIPGGAISELRWGQLYGSAPALALAELAVAAAQPVLLVCEEARDADRLEGEIGFFGGSALNVLQFPDWETLPYDVFSPYQDIVSRRLATLAALPEMRSGVIIIPLSTLMQRVAPPAFVHGNSMRLASGQSLDLENFRRRLVDAGYRSVSQVTEHGEFAVRGALVDVFPMGIDAPLRIDLFDQEIESLRCFDPDTQLSSDQLPGVDILPAREFPLDERGIRSFRQNFRRRFEGDPTQASIYREVSDGIAPPGIEYYLPLFFETTASIFDYLPRNTIVAKSTRLEDSAQAFWHDVADRYEQRKHDLERPVLAPQELFLAPEEMLAKTSTHATVSISAFEQLPDAEAAGHANFATAQPPELTMDPRADQPLARLRKHLQRAGSRTLLVAESAGRRESLLEQLSDSSLRLPVFEDFRAFITGTGHGITTGPLEAGLEIPAAAVSVVTESQLLGERVRQRKKRRRADRDPDAIIRDLTDLTPGAPVVHEEHGVGRYLGLEVLDTGGVRTEYLSLEYADGDRLYVPVHALQLISRYTGASPEHAPLHKLGSTQWQKARQRAAKKARDVAAELLDIYARRAARSGRSFDLDLHEYEAFRAAFPFEETADQAQAIDAVVEDMRAPKSMDRVVCGDVGFGKTEVALRAAFVAVQAGRQVALLVPTTLLAQQHYQTFADRFADWPVNVEVLSRFRTGARSREVLAQLAAGTVDIVVGTHRLLQGDITFKSLGLVIIDEEHRFGVRHKERLKALRAEVDVLTLTATPIPRTLNMALGGVRDLSLITTPPDERLAVKTFVTQWNDVLLREAVLREVRRGGQVFYVHNRVKSIDAAAEKLAALVPEAHVGIAHGQMSERALERVMLDFYHRRFNLLACTTIIESGIDIPTANTIIIDRADRFGLAQLHQLRGRVGRSHHRAYAYLVTPPEAALTEDARKRLVAIEAMEELGSGFLLATHDLEIRGAGELLGEEQSGQIQEIGFSLYLELLDRAVRALREGHEPDLERPLDHGPEIDLQMPALLPGDYMPDVHMRLILYKRIAGAPDEDALRELQVEMIDRFGLLPDAASALFEITRLKLRAEPLGVRAIKLGAAGGRIVFTAEPPVDALSVIELVQGSAGEIRFDGQDTIRISRAMPQPNDRLTAVRSLLKSLRLGDNAGKRQPHVA